MSTITLQSIVDAADKKYGPTVIDLGDGSSLTLLPALRLPKETRKKLAELTSSEDGDVDEKMIESLRLVATSERDVDNFLALVDNDLAVVSEVFAAYNGSSELGEASPSES